MLEPMVLLDDREPGLQVKSEWPETTKSPLDQPTKFCPLLPLALPQTRLAFPSGDPKPLKLLARSERFELPTLRFEVWRSDVSPVKFRTRTPRADRRASQADRAGLQGGLRQHKLWPQAPHRASRADRGARFGS
jgi:hypothetical protein